ncbi:SusF/SusE family outer membrane protein [Pontibacter sp. MBLB2868]|uniref:SusF/SusE family outer membrane protein n=1 Tax=Pontibacter sp. MBLB2868 TaxID=3451555 RepID=UPI003F753D47
MNIIKQYNKQHSGRGSLLQLLCTTLFFMMGAGLLSSCDLEYEEYAPAKATVQGLTASATELNLKQSRASSNAVTFNWSSGTNHGTDAAIDYTIQFDKKGNNFADPVDVALGRVVYTNSYRVVDFNNLLVNEMGLEPGVAHDVEVRVKSVEASGNFEADYSNVVTVTATPYRTLTSTLFMLGDATPNGWSADNATPLRRDNSNPAKFTYEGPLAPGEFKFITTLGQFLPSYQKGADASTLVYRTEDSQPDDKFRIEKAATYKVTVNLEELTISVEEQAGPAYNRLWMVGSATPNGWDLDNATQMAQSDSDPFIFTYTGTLAEGELKIATAKDWGAPFYRPTIADAPLTSTEVQLSAGDPDNKWKVADGGMYKVTLNLRTMSITFTPVNLYLVGDAGPNGWNVGSPEPMTRNGSVYTYTGPLTAGELKISMFKGDWCDGQWINAASPDQAITNGSYITTNGCEGPDNKWRVTDATAGNYTITIDLVAKTMTVVKQ